MTNGSPRIDKTIVTFAVSLIGIGATWGALNWRVSANEDKADQTEKKAQENRETLIEVSQKMEALKDKVDQVSNQQEKTGEKVDEIKNMVQEIFIKMNLR